MAFTVHVLYSTLDMSRSPGRMLHNYMSQVCRHPLYAASHLHTLLSLRLLVAIRTVQLTTPSVGHSIDHSPRDLARILPGATSSGLHGMSLGDERQHARPTTFNTTTGRVPARRVISGYWLAEPLVLLTCMWLNHAVARRAVLNNTGAA